MRRLGEARECALLIGGEWADGEGSFDVHDPYRGDVVAVAQRASRDGVDQAVAAARAACEAGPPEPFRRFEILRRAAALIGERRDELLQLIPAETGFTVADARSEVDRCVQTLTESAEEAKRITGEMVPIEAAPGQRGRMAYTIRVPVGVVCAITPFNSPLNTVSHKVAPALAAGNAVVLKPSEQTPGTADMLCRAFVDAGLPPGFLNLLHGAGDVGRWLVEHSGVDFYTFTGSSAVGAEIRRGAGLRRTSLELGSVSATIVCDDADLEWAATRCVAAGFRKAGQVCTSVQRLYVQRGAFDVFMGLLTPAVEALPVGDPFDPTTRVGPMIDDAAAARAEAWVAEAVAAGARIVTGGTRDGRLFRPTVLDHVTPVMKVMCEEIFAPVLSVAPFDDLDEALERVNDTPYGLAAGIFTRDLARAIEASRRLRVGGVHVNDTSSSRVDLMPYGGVKASGYGWEGPRYAIREMTEERLVTIRWRTGG